MVRDFAVENSRVYVALTPDINGVVHYSQEDHQTWKLLYNRQIEIIRSRACPEFMEGIARLGLCAEQIPQCADVSEALRKHSGWSVKPVEALISFKEFFEMLAARNFPAATFIRHREDVDYLKEPDIFHELFGHCPMLTNPAFAGFTQEVGKLGMTLPKEERATLARLYWFTVEFGLIECSEGLRIYGGGILSSKEESIYALESPIPERRPFDLVTVLRTPYRYDELQKNYFVIDNFDSLFELLKSDLRRAFSRAKELGLIDIAHENIDDVRSC